MDDLVGLRTSHHDINVYVDEVRVGAVYHEVDRRGRSPHHGAGGWTVVKRSLAEKVARPCKRCFPEGAANA